MNDLKTWWNNGLPKSVKFVFFVLMANAVPAFIILMTLPTMTELLFVWTIKPVINAHLVGVMYGNALMLVLIGMAQPNWPRVRIIMVVITLFSVFATVLTFFFLKPFLAHPWYHLTYWLTMYLILFFAAPVVFVMQERKHGGRLPIQIPLNFSARLVAVVSMIISLITGLGLIYRLETISLFWPWVLPPLVAGLIGVLFTTHAAAYAWSLWDGDWRRSRPIFWQAPITGIGFILLPLVHPNDLRPDAGEALNLYYVLAGFLVLVNLAVVLSYRSAEKRQAAHG